MLAAPTVTTLTVTYIVSGSGPAREHDPDEIARDRRGFTLVEMLVGMAVLGIVLASMASLLSAIYNTGTQTVEASTLQDEARSAVDTLVADLRQAYTGDTATLTLVASISSTAITFYSPDRQQPFHLRKIATSSPAPRAPARVRDQHRYGRGAVARADVAWRLADRSPTRLVANPGGTPLFSYQKEDGTAATAAKDVARVIVTVTVKQPGSRNKASTYQSSADLRAYQP